MIALRTLSWRSGTIHLLGLNDSDWDYTHASEGRICTEKMFTAYLHIQKAILY